MWTLQNFTDYIAPLFKVLYLITALGAVLVVVSENRNPLKTISWVLVLLLLPFVGLVFYFFFGQNTRKLIIISRRTDRKSTRLNSSH